ncbi:uncharacterized protein LOC124935413 [Impatiens glandulifera]|uniref:uncharacterized protein LOC124935413 n=1 Tax=Impatiens glandulifera TaxID=253017 RepID=UPI001FB0DAF4|nr:uncharacterized protein LOC124935413 [Impatiens glandulifera]
MLGSSLKEIENGILRAEQLRKAFSNKKVVVLLDDVWKELQSQQLHYDKIDKVVLTSYDFLEDPNARSLFLFCCLFQEDEEIPIETLYRYVVGFQLFKVKMHDVARDVGISIAKQENNGINYLECDDMDELENIGTPHTKMISIFRKNNLDVFNTVEFRGSKLELLRLDSSNDYLPNIKISWNLLKVEDNLKVINIVFHLGKISEFPSKLKMLSLERLSLDMSVSSIGHIKCLKILSLRDSTIKDLLNEISELTNLRLLDLTRCKCFIFNGVLSKLTNLEELYMWESFQDWRLQKKDVNGGDNHAAGIDELNYLHKLWKLELEVPNIEQVPRGVMLFSSSTLLEQFKIRIGGECERTKFESGKRQLWLENDRNNTTSFLHELGVLIEKGITNLFISNDLYKGLNENHFYKLKRLELKGLKQFIFPTTKLEMPCLEEVKILSIPNIESLCNFVAPSLKSLSIDSCDSLRYVLSENFLMSVSHFTKLFIANCKMLKGIIGVSTGVEEQWEKSIEFPNLKELELKYLDKLTSIVVNINNLDDEE